MLIDKSQSDMVLVAWMQCIRAAVAVATCLSVCYVDVLCQVTESIIMAPSCDCSPAVLVFPYQI